MTNVELLKEKVAKSGLKSSFIAESVGISRGSWYNKLNGKSPFTAEEIKKLCDTLHITSLREREEIFFS
jgi:antitoxin component HigA of HigAB toxin-antitoxin module